MADRPFDAEELERLDKAYIWHPFTQMKDWLADTPLIIASGDGSYLTDVQGRRYLDGVSSLWVTVHGHRRAEITQAIRDQLDSIAHSTFLGLSHVSAIKLAERLVHAAVPGERSPESLAKVFYSDNGSTAVEVALKMAFQYWQQQGGGSAAAPAPPPNGGPGRHATPISPPGLTPVGRGKTRFISMVNGYHGDTIGSVSLGGVDLFHQVYRPLLFHTIKANSPYCYRCPWDKDYPSCAPRGIENAACVQEMAQLMERHHDEVAAVVMEPLIQAAAGMIVFPQGYTRCVRQLAAKHDILFVADEVATGFGRTGAMFACHLEGVQPDLVAVAKGITGGYLPLAATLTTQDVFDAFCGDYAEKKTFFHGHSYTANPLACAAAMASLDIFEKDRTLEQLAQKQTYLAEELLRFKSLSHVGDIRRLGFMVGVELVRDPNTREAYPYEDRIGMRVIREARNRGAILRPLDNVIVLMPPLSISHGELTRLLEITYDSIRAVTE